MKRKYVAVGIILLLVGIAYAPAMAETTEKVSSQGTWLYVGGSGPGNYSRIQDAIDNASDGDTVFVYSGMYCENINIPLTLCLIGENNTNTIIEGNETDVAVNITADYVNITGFCIQNSWGGGILIEARYATIAHNRFTNNTYGIGINYPYKTQNKVPQALYAFPSRDHKKYSQNDYNTLMNNTVSNNEVGVIIFINSSNNTLINNSFSNTRTGVMIGRSSNNFLKNNTFVHSGLYVFNDTSANTFVNNTVNGKPLLYLEDQSNIVVPDGLGQLVLLRCHNITVTDQELTNTNFGIELIDTTHCYISQNIIASNIISGILLLNSFYTTITNNTISANKANGIYIWGSNNTVTGNTITFNVNGIGGFNSNYNIIKQNNISNNYRGVEFVYSHIYNIISENIIHSNKDCGIQIDHGKNNILAQNDITSNSMEGISMTYCQQNIIQNNMIAHHHDGIRLGGSDNNYIGGNSIMENGYGIDLGSSCHCNIISDNNLFLNNTCGIHMYRSNSNIIVHNNFVHNTQEGIVCSASQKNIITENTISWNHPTLNYRSGIILAYSTNTTITDNTIINASCGVDIDFESNDNTILRNNIQQSFSHAILCRKFSSNNLICSNSMVKNSIGIAIQRSNNTLIMDNTITRSTNAGINIEYKSFHTIISKNVLSENFVGIFLDDFVTETFVNNNIIKGNLGAGVFLQSYAANNTIIENVFQNNILGINISGDSNSIHHNMILDNSLGIFIWMGSDNTICYNTFSGTNRHASFNVYLNEKRNTWNKNYWGKPRVLPQLVIGNINVWFGYQFVLPWLNVDWHPAQEPYDISGVY